EADVRMIEAVTIKMSVHLAPELDHAVREAAGRACRCPHGWPRRQAKLRRDRDARILAEAAIAPLGGTPRVPGRVASRPPGLQRGGDGACMADAQHRRPGMSAPALDAGALVDIDGDDRDPDDLRRLCEAAGNKALVIGC